jgi:four helix bundle protein
MELVEQLYRVSEQFPDREKYGLSAQLRRAAVSIPSNIAEGHARNHLKEYLNHLSIAQASLAEVETQVEIALRLRYVGSETYQAILARVVSLHRQLHALRKSLSAKP